MLIYDIESSLDLTDLIGKPMFTYRFTLIVAITCSFSGLNLFSEVSGQESFGRTNGNHNRSAIFQPISRNKVTVPVRSSAYQIRKQEIAADADFTWEETAEGWQQVPQRNLSVVHIIDEPYNPPRVHPFSIASLMLLLAMAAMAWSSSEWDWCRMIGADPKAHR